MILQQTPSEQALVEKLMEEINSNIQLRIQIVVLQARIKQLEGAAAQSDDPHLDKPPNTNGKALDRQDSL